ncbi:MAG: HEAT repeat domain-containing protein [bacterium]
MCGLKSGKRPWLKFRRCNVSISIQTNQSYDTLLELALALDREIERPTRFAKLGDPSAKLSLSIPSNTVEEDKQLEVRLEIPDDSSLLQVRYETETGIAVYSEDRPDVVIYRPQKLGRDEIYVEALLKGERVLSASHEIHVSESPERKARIEELTQILSGDTDLMERLDAIGDLSNLVDTRDRSCVPVLLNLLESESHVGMRQHTIRALSKIGDTRAVPPLLEILAQPIRGNIKDRHDDEAVVRREAICALGELGDQTILPVLRSITENAKDYPSVRECAGVSIGQIEGEIPRAYNKN